MKKKNEHHKNFYAGKFRDKDLDHVFDPLLERFVTPIYPKSILATATTPSAANSTCVGQTMYSFKANCGQWFNSICHEIFTELTSNRSLGAVSRFNLAAVESIWRDPTVFKNVKFNKTGGVNCDVVLSRPSNIFSHDPKRNNLNCRRPLTFKGDVSPQSHAFAVVYFPPPSTNRSESYLLTTMLVAFMLKYRQHNFTGPTKAAVICCVTKDVDDYARKLLSLVYDEIVQVPTISWSDSADIRIQDISRGNISVDHVYSKVLTKLNVFNLTKYKKVILLDADLYPMCHFDSLFSLDAPAGCLEHRRSLVDQLGCHSWKYDRSLFAPHGHEIPKVLTDLGNIVAADVNASLLVIEPSQSEFESMLTQLKTPLNQWFSSDKQHKGCWLGDQFYNFYVLPEQNYLTQRYSGKWKSVDFGFSSWCLDMHNCFGFTFAGFIVKPWVYQASMHKYSINSFVKFTKINNMYSQRSLACQLFNTNLCLMLNKFPVLTPLVNMKIVQKPYDPWYPETVVKTQGIDLRDCPEDILSFDQKFLKRICMNAELQSLALDLSVLESISKLESPDILLLKQKLYDQIVAALPIELGQFETDSFNKTILAFCKQLQPREIVKKLLEKFLRVYVYSNGKFTQIVFEQDKPLYLEYGRTPYQVFESACFCNIEHINVTFYESTIEEFFDNNHSVHPSFVCTKNKFALKSPVCEIFFGAKEFTDALNTRPIQNEISVALDAKITQVLNLRFQANPPLIKRIFNRFW